jgi:hypothetical protein
MITAIILAAFAGVFLSGLAFGWVLRTNVATRTSWPERPQWAPKRYTRR